MGRNVTPAGSRPLPSLLFCFSNRSKQSGGNFEHCLRFTLLSPGRSFPGVWQTLKPRAKRRGSFLGYWLLVVRDHECGGVGWREREVTSLPVPPRYCEGIPGRKKGEAVLPASTPVKFLLWTPTKMGRDWIEKVKWRAEGGGERRGKCCLYVANCVNTKLRDIEELPELAIGGCRDVEQGYIDR